MSTITSLHNDAMKLAEEGQAALLAGSHTKAKRKFKSAFQKEKQAALELKDEFDSEPNRSVLLRSAASLAMDCNELREAERLIAIALIGDPPPSIREELLSLLEDVNFQRHLNLTGLELASSEFQIVLTGNSIAHGLAESASFLSRAEFTEKLLSRTKQRLENQEFGPLGRDSLIQTYMSVPRAASFAVTMRIGHPNDQLTLKNTNNDYPSVFTTPEDVLDEFFNCIQAFSENDIPALKTKIPEESYFRNFIECARKIAPDGDQIKSVSFSSRKKKKLVNITMQGPPSQKWRDILRNDPSIKRTYTIEGVLKAADEIGRRSTVGLLLENNGKSAGIIVPEGMLDDIVRPLWGEKVVIKVSEKTNGRKELLEIEKAK